jgi:hypothetical protein
MSKTQRIAAVPETIGVNMRSPTLASIRPLLGPAWIIEGEDPQRYEKVLAEVGAAARPIDFIDWLLVKDVVDLTWDIQRARLQRERLTQTERLSSLRSVIFSILYPGYDPYLAEKDPTVSRVLTKWAQGDPKGIKRVDELLAESGLSMAEVDLQSLSERSVNLEQLDERDERLARRRDEILRQIERRRSGWAKLVRHSSEEVIEGECHELPSGSSDVAAGPGASDGGTGRAPVWARGGSQTTDQSRQRSNGG